MSSLIPLRPDGGDERSDRPDAPLQERLTEEERLGRIEVRAAQWKAVELARMVFGQEVGVAMVGLRHRGPLRGLLRLDVPFDSLERHREREGMFLSLVGRDPLLTRVPLVYILGPDAR
ncbi:MAG: hypothetical protein P8170_05825 [Gemmatimonadota bacterium]